MGCKVGLGSLVLDREGQLLPSRSHPCVWCYRCCCSQVSLPGLYQGCFTFSCQCPSSRFWAQENVSGKRLESHSGQHRSIQVAELQALNSSCLDANIQNKHGSFSLLTCSGTSPLCLQRDFLGSARIPLQQPLLSWHQQPVRILRKCCPAWESSCPGTVLLPVLVCLGDALNPLLP